MFCSNGPVFGPETSKSMTPFVCHYLFCYFCHVCVDTICLTPVVLTAFLSHLCLSPGVKCTNRMIILRVKYEVDDYDDFSHMDDGTVVRTDDGTVVRIWTTVPSSVQTTVPSSMWTTMYRLLYGRRYHRPYRQRCRRSHGRQYRHP